MSETNICVVGLGYVGLPTALAFHNKGFKIYGVDVSDEIVEKLRSGKSHLVDSSAKLRIPINDDSWKVSSEFHEAVGMSDVVLITVPTPVNEDKSPDFGYVEAASHSVLSNLDRRKRTVVVLESTVFPGITRRILGGICEKLDLTDGKEVVLAYCPERVSPGEANFSVESVARVVGCDDEDTGRMLASLYGQITDSSSDYVGKLEVAEASKMVENLQRDIDIALANELSIVLPRIGVDVEDVLDAADTKWNFHRHTPGIGVGGHCIPVDPYYYISLARSVGYESILSITARSINENMPMISVDEIQLLIGGDSLAGKRVLVLGYSYKPNVGDIRETPIKDFIKYIFTFSQILIF